MKRHISYTFKDLNVGRIMVDCLNDQTHRIRTFNWKQTYNWYLNLGQ